MSTIAERVAAGHHSISTRYTFTCKCGMTFPNVGRREAYLAHVAEVAVSATRAQIAADIEAHRWDRLNALDAAHPNDAADFAYEAAARIAAGGAS